MKGTGLLANLAAEEGDDWPASADTPAARATARLWSLLFPPQVRLLSPDDLQPRSPAPWPADLGPAPAGAAFERMETLTGVVPWLSTPDALERAQRAAGTLAATPPEIVARVHTKAFAQTFAREQGWEPRPLRGLVRLLEPALLERPDEALATIRSALQSWPEWTQGRFTLKPCLGTSGRGRVGGVGPEFDSTAIRGALGRLAERGGCLLEPWLDRTGDFSAQLWIEADRSLVLLGTSQQIVTGAGVYLGQRGEIDSRGRVFTGAAFEEEIREAAADLAGAAAAAGYRGPCGVDAFAFREADGRERLRPIVEFNARYTMGIVAVGLLRRAHSAIRNATGLAPGERRAFELRLAAPSGSWAAAVERSGGTLFHLSPGSTRDDAGPGLWVTDSLADLEEREA